VTEGPEGNDPPDAHEPGEASEGEAEGYRRASKLIRNLSIGGAVVIGLLAGYQLVTRGASSVSSLSTADYRVRSEVGNGPAPDFTLPVLGGDAKMSLRSLRGSIVVLNFWASWCAPCRREAPGLERAAVAYRARGVRFLGVDEQDDAAAALAFQREFGITYPSVSDPGGSLVDDYGLLGLPTTYVISRQGRLLLKLSGFLDEPTLVATLDSVLKTSPT
jgi:cytochrome c biogenesis protein CcmG/thiol:disulfide interchange protein DsbE